MKTILRRKKSARRASRSREGAAMLVVMLLLLIVTATATFAVQTTTTEIHAAGYQRQHMQARHLAEGALVSGIAMAEIQGPEATRISIQRSTAQALRTGAGTTRRLAPDEPPMAAAQGNYRIDSSQFVAGSAPGLAAPPVGTAAGVESFGPGMGYQPAFVIDVNDEHVFSGVVPGQRADGLGQLEYVSVTYTARGAARVGFGTDGFSPRAPADDAASTQDDWLRRGYHETVSTARAIGISGPTRRR